ncbi:MAG: DUF5131 family protein [Desulfurellales bacterium]|nr:MAG: DUF5131 family protein [Desulfurellales bacterium]
MAENSKIEWTHHTFNPWIGCTKVHTGCAHCYAEEMMDHRYGKAKWGPQGTRVRTTDANWRKPLAWDRAAAKSGERHRVFCASLADVFESWDGDIVDSKGRQLLREDIQGRITMDYMRRELFQLIDATPNLDWLLLTKRPENVRRMWPHRSGPWIKEGKACVESWRRDNVWLGTSISDQSTANVMVPRLLESRDLCEVLFLSAEPLVGPVSLRTGIYSSIVESESVGTSLDGIDWVIVGGESGIGRRPMDLGWARYLRDQCESANVAFFMKQIDKVQEIPDDLMVRQFPTPSTEPASV